METAKQKDFLIKTAFYAAVTALIYIGLRLLSGPLFPFAAAAVFAVSIQRFLRKWARRLKLRKKAASVAFVIIIYLVAGAVVISLGYVLYRQTVEFIRTLPEYSVQFSVKVAQISEKFGNLRDKMPEFAGKMFGDIPKTALDSLTDRAATAIAGVAGKFAAGVPYFLLSLIVMIIASAYMAKDYDEISKYIVRRLPRPTARKLLFFKDAMLHKLVKLFKGYFIIMVMTFCELGVGLLLLRCRYALIIAAVTALVDILPVLGSGTVLIPWALFSAAAGNPKRAAGLILMYVVITIVRNIAEPKIIGMKLGVHPVVMLISVFLGLTLFGAAGIILMPITVVVLGSFLQIRDGDKPSASEETEKDDKNGRQEHTAPSRFAPGS